MIDACIEVAASVLAFIAFFAAAWAWGSAEDYLKKTKRKKINAVKRRKEMQNAIHEKDIADYYNMAVRHMTSESRSESATFALPESKSVPIRAVKGVFAKQFYELSEDERKRIL